MELSSGAEPFAALAASRRAWDAEGWCWAPEGPVDGSELGRFTTDQWAPATVVRRPWVRVGGWTVLYHRRRRWTLTVHRRAC